MENFSSLAIKIFTRSKTINTRKLARGRLGRNMDMEGLFEDTADSRKVYYLPTAYEKQTNPDLVRCSPAKRKLYPEDLHNNH